MKCWELKNIKSAIKRMPNREAIRYCRESSRFSKAAELSRTAGTSYPSQSFIPTQGNGYSQQKDDDGHLGPLPTIQRHALVQRNVSTMLRGGESAGLSLQSRPCNVALSVMSSLQSVEAPLSLDNCRVFVLLLVRQCAGLLLSGGVPSIHPVCLGPGDRLLPRTPVLEISPRKALHCHFRAL